MPNRPRRDKKLRPGSPRSRGGSHRPDSVKDLLGRASPALAAIAEQRARQNTWRAWLDERLPAALLAHVTGLIERDGELVLFTASASWGVRIRYALAELETPEGIERILVRVLPRGAAP